MWPIFWENLFVRIGNHAFSFEVDFCFKWSVLWIRHVVKTYKDFVWYTALHFIANLWKSSNRFDRPVNDFTFHHLDHSAHWKYGCSIEIRKSSSKICNITGEKTRIMNSFWITNLNDLTQFWEIYWFLKNDSFETDVTAPTTCLCEIDFFYFIFQCTLHHVFSTW